MASPQNILDERSKDRKVFEVAADEARLYALSWVHIADAAIILPELETKGRDLIERRLGYLPHDAVISEYEPFLRGLIQSYEQGALTKEAFADRAEEHIKLIRNADLIHNICLDYDAGIYNNYEVYLAHYKDAAKQRLTGFLGYEPKIEHSLIAEMWLREVLSRDFLQLPVHITAIDIKALTLIKYREALLEHGQAAANASPLLGIEPVIVDNTDY